VLEPRCGKTGSHAFDLLLTLRLQFIFVFTKQNLRGEAKRPVTVHFIKAVRLHGGDLLRAKFALWRLAPG